ncbi:hypothetical protein N0V90_010125 [Kalmusia sp. IMI 367209]|nr:hypothetical protein N0V90_010125 [Kalmusia sp. IMI 367209]
MLGINTGAGNVHQIEDQGEEEAFQSTGFKPLPSRRTMKRQRSSQAAMVLDAMPDEARNLYWTASHGKIDYSYFSPVPRKRGGLPRRDPQSVPTKGDLNARKAITVTRSGFQGTVRNQLSRGKTAQEMEWARLKGPSWPPWKENRNAMDESKDYMFGASRASRILHRLYDAGYEGRTWEEMAQVYAGWDTDLSPTIQTRTTLAQDSSRGRDSVPKSLLWAARVRTTRTRREAWACFLAYEAFKAPSSREVYLAMFEKLYYPEIEDQQPEKGAQPANPKGSHGTHLLPGDMRGSLARSQVAPASYLSTCFSLLKGSQNMFDGGIQILLEGSFSRENTVLPVPDYFMGSFIRFLCRFGRFSQLPPAHPVQLSPKDHVMRLQMDETYLIDYAYALLLHYCPAYRPAWTTYMQKVIYGKNKRRSGETQYTIMCNIFEKMNEIDLDPDDDQFQLLCTVLRYAAQAAHKGKLSLEYTHQVLSSGPPLLRTVFHNLIGANIDPNATGPSTSEADILPPHIPSPAVFHAHVRALGILRDYEGLYSFSSWLTTHHKEVTVRTNAQHGGPKILYRTMVALRAGLEGTLDKNNVHGGAPREILELVKAQIEGVEGWVWPPEEHVGLYINKDSKG